METNRSCLEVSSTVSASKLGFSSQKKSTKDLGVFVGCRTAGADTADVLPDVAVLGSETTPSLHIGGEVP